MLLIPIVELRELQEMPLIWFLIIGVVGVLVVATLVALQVRRNMASGEDDTSDRGFFFDLEASTRDRERRSPRWDFPQSRNEGAAPDPDVILNKVRRHAAMTTIVDYAKTVLDGTADRAECRGWVAGMKIIVAPLLREDETKARQAFDTFVTLLEKYSNGDDNGEMVFNSAGVLVSHMQE